MENLYSLLKRLGQKLPPWVEEKGEIFAEDVYGMVWGYTRKWFNDPELADELTQEVFLRLIRYVSEHGIANFETFPQFTGWLFEVAKNLCLAEQKRRKKRPNLGSQEVAAPDAARNRENLEQLLKEKRDFGRALRLLRRKESQKARLLWWHYRLKRAISEIAPRMAATEGPGWAALPAEKQDEKTGNRIYTARRAGGRIYTDLTNHKPPGANGRGDEKFYNLLKNWPRLSQCKRAQPGRNGDDV